MLKADSVIKEVVRLFIVIVALNYNDLEEIKELEAKFKFKLQARQLIEETRSLENLSPF